jgi:putative aminopeptidase FrvX
MLSILESILSQPTAPFHEYYVRDEIVRIFADSEFVTVTEDAYGNLIARYSFGESKTPAWAFGSHMDHPGWVRDVAGSVEPAVEQTHRRRGGFTFLGGVPADYFSGEPAIEEFGDFAMWDLPAFKHEDGIIHGRACDDLAGCAAIISTLKELEEQKVAATCYGLFTRAEEVGFNGAIELARNWPLEIDVTFVSIETSIATAKCKMGDGPMCRVGDRMTIFDSDTTSAMMQIAEDEGIPAQRALLDLGSCEATAMQAFGITSAGISLPLGNYHNCAPDNRIEAEFIAEKDYVSLVRLMTALVKKHPEGIENPGADLRKKLEDRVQRHATYADATAARFGEILA